MTDRRTLYVLRYPAHLFAAHMALFIPHADSEQDDLGKVLHATGDQRSGFVREFKRNYSALDTARRPTRHVLGTVDAVFVIDVVGDGELLIETDPAEADAQDEIERVALSVAAPGPSLRNAADVREGKLTRIEPKNCQTWLREVIDALVQKSILDASALLAFDAIPK